LTIDVDYLPPDIPAGKDSVCVVIDVLRASSTIAALFDKGSREVWLTNDIDGFLANHSGERNESLVVCAESVAGYCLEGADFGPSLEDMAGNNMMAGKNVLMQTTNGTVAVHTLIKRGKDKIFIGCMRNATTVMKAAVDMAGHNSTGIHIVCAGREAGTSYTIDDVYCAAWLVERAMAVAQETGVTLDLNDSAKLALMTLRYFDSAWHAFDASASGAIMRKVDRPGDIELCAMDDVSQSVPVLQGYTTEGYLRLVPFKWLQTHRQKKEEAHV